MQVKMMVCDNTKPVRRLGGELRSTLRQMSSDGTLVLDLRAFAPTEGTLEDALFELMVSLNCCSANGPLPGRRIVVAIDSPALLAAFEWNLNKLHRANLVLTEGCFNVAGAALGSTHRGLWDTLREAPGALAIADMARAMNLSRRSIDAALEDLLAWGLVIQLPAHVQPAQGRGRPSAQYQLTQEVCGDAILSAVAPAFELGLWR